MTDTKTSSTMSEERLLRFFDACNIADIDGIASFFTEDAIYYGSVGPHDDGTVFTGINAVREGMATFLNTYEDPHYSDLDILISGSRGFAKWTFSGILHNGELFTYRGVDTFEFEGVDIRIKDAFRKEKAQPVGQQQPGRNQPIRT